MKQSIMIVWLTVWIAFFCQKFGEIFNEMSIRISCVLYSYSLIIHCQSRFKKGKDLNNCPARSAEKNPEILTVFAKNCGDEESVW